MAVPRISKEELKQQIDSGAAPVLVDARLKYPYEHSTLRLPGAIRFPATGPAPALPRDRDVVVYDSDPNELASSQVAAGLIRQGYRAVALSGGITRMDRRQSSDGNERGAKAGAARTGRTERLAPFRSNRRSKNWRRWPESARICRIRRCSLPPLRSSPHSRCIQMPTSVRCWMIPRQTSIRECWFDSDTCTTPEAGC